MVIFCRRRKLQKWPLILFQQMPCNSLDIRVCHFKDALGDFIEHILRLLRWFLDKITNLNRLGRMERADFANAELQFPSIVLDVSSNFYNFLSCVQTLYFIGYIPKFCLNFPAFVLKY